MHRLPLIALFILTAAMLVAGCGGKKYDESLWGENVNYGEVLDGFMRRAEQGMMQIRDMASAQAASDNIGMINKDLDDLVYNAPRLSDQGQIELGKIAAEHLTKVQSLKADLDRNPMLGEVFEANLNEMMALLTTMVSGNYQESPVG